MKTTFIIIAVIILILFIFKRRYKKRIMQKSVANLDDFTLSEIEKETADILKQVILVLLDNPNAKFHPKMHFQEAMDEIATEIFKYGLWRLNDVELANRFFRNRDYIKVNKDKFIFDFDKKMEENYFELNTNIICEKYFLFWVLKYRDDSKNIDTFLS